MLLCAGPAKGKEQEEGVIFVCLQNFLVKSEAFSRGSGLLPPSDPV